MAAMHLNSQVQQYDGFTPVGRVFWQGAEITLWVGWRSFFEDFTNPVDAPTAEAQNLTPMISEIPQASIKADPQKKQDTTLTRRLGNAKNGGIFDRAESYLFVCESKIKKKREKMVGPGIIIERFGNKYALVHSR